MMYITCVFILAINEEDEERKRQELRQRLLEREKVTTVRVIKVLIITG